MLARLGQLVQQDSAVRTEKISDEFARGLGQDYEGQRRPPPGAIPGGHEDAIRKLSVRMGTPDGSSIDELRNYAELKRREREGLPATEMAVARGQYEQARGRAADTVRGSEAAGGVVPTPPLDPPAPPAASGPSSALPEASEKARLLAELEAAGNRTASEIGMIGQESPGTKRALEGQLDQRKRDILAKLAAIAPAPMPSPQQPPAMQIAAAPPPPALVAAAPPVLPAASPVATYPLVPPPIYPPSPAYPVPAAPNVPALDDAAARAASTDYARFRLGR